MPEPLYPNNGNRTNPPYPPSWGNQDQFDAPVVTVGEWLIVHILLCIPLVNIVLLVMWAFDRNGNPNRANFAKARLILIGIVILLAALFMGMFMGMIMRFTEAFNYI